MNVPSPYTLPEINFIGGSTQEFIFHAYTDGNKEAFSLASCVANFAIINYVNKSGEPLISKDMSITFDDESDSDTVYNVLKVTLLPSETVDLCGKYIYQITIKDIEDNTEPKQGIMYIGNNINKSYIT